MLVLDDSRIKQIHPKGVAHPTNGLLDEVRGFSRLVLEDAGPDSQQVGRVLLLIFLGYGGAHSSCHGPEEDCDPGPGDVGQGIFFTITRYRH
jgi:hypothetical protein